MSCAGHAHRNMICQSVLLKPVLYLRTKLTHGAETRFGCKVLIYLNTCLNKRKDKGSAVTSDLEAI